MNVKEVLTEFNAKYMVINNGGKILIYESAIDSALNRKMYNPMSFGDFKNAYLNREVVFPQGKTANAAAYWLKHPNRRQYLGGLVFDPSEKLVRPDQLNLWSGFAYVPKKGSWGKLRDHLHKVVCQGNDGHFRFLLSTSARMVQFPGERSEVAIVMKGKEGVGKGIYANTMVKLLGQHGFRVSNAVHLVGRFNGHLRDCVVLFADEAFYAGDKQHEGVLKSTITEEHLTMENKFERTMLVKNCLHLIMASNEEWVVPASLDSRRFFVLLVPPDRMGDLPYFKAIMDELEDGGYEAMLYDLLNIDLSGFDHRDIPMTSGLIEQRKLSLDTPTVWWKEMLTRGYVVFTHEEVWFDELETGRLHFVYTEFAKERGDRRPLGLEKFCEFMKSMGAQKKRHAGSRDGKRGYVLGSLAAARKAFEEATKLTVDWDDKVVDLNAERKTRKPRPSAAS